MQALKLTFPSQNPGTFLLVKTDFEQLSYWLEGLPSGNMTKFVPMVRDAAMNLNRTELPIAQRVKLMKLLDKAYEKIHHFYRPLMHSGPFKGKHPPPNELAELNQLTTEMSFGYKISVTEFASKKKLFGKNKDLANAINMALHYLGLMLLESYEMYSPIPMHVWSEIYQIYHYAEAKDISELKNDVSHTHNCFAIIEETFLRNCLIALSNPYHLKRGDHWEVFAYLGHWIGKAVLSEDPEDFSEKNCFVIDLTHDDKPLAMKELPESVQHTKQRFILTNQVNLYIRHQIEEVQSTGKSPDRCFSKNVVAKKATYLLEDLLASWEMKQIRQSSRYPIISRMEVIWGLVNIHTVLSLLDPLQPGSIEQRQNEIDEAKRTIIESDWNTVNNSNGGICIRLSDEKVRDLDVGQLVCLRQSIQDNNAPKVQAWHLGVICWITGSQRAGTKVGVQFLNGEIQPVQLQARKGNILETRFQPAIMLSGEKVEGLSTPTVITAPGIYVEARAMRMQIGEEVQNIHARKKVSSTMSVDRFFFQQDFNPLTMNAEEVEEQPLDNEEEVINLNSTPGTYAEDFQDEEEARKRAESLKPSLDDVIVREKK